MICTKFTASEPRLLTASMEEPYFHFHVQPLLNSGYELESWLWTTCLMEDETFTVRLSEAHLDIESTDSHSVWFIHDRTDLTPNQMEVNSVTVRLSFVMCRIFFLSLIEENSESTVKCLCHFGIHYSIKKRANTDCLWVTEGPILVLYSMCPWVRAAPSDISQNHSVHWSAWRHCALWFLFLLLVNFCTLLLKVRLDVSSNTHLISDCSGVTTPQRQARSNHKPLLFCVSHTYLTLFSIFF